MHRSIRYMVVLSGFFFLVSLLTVFRAQAQSAVDQVIISYGEALAEENGEVRVELFVSVLDDESRAVRGLTTEDFTVNENGTQVDNELSVARVTEPIEVVLLVDTSSSVSEPMADNVLAIDAVKNATIDFINRLPEEDLVAVYGYNDRLNSQQSLTYDHNLAIDQGILKMEGTETEQACLYDALLGVMNELVDSEIGRRLVIVLSGSANTSVTEGCEANEIDVLDIKTRAGNSIPIFTIGFSPEADEEALSRLSRLSGGASLPASDQTTLTDVLTSVSDQLRNEYKISYPAQAGSGMAVVSVAVNEAPQSRPYRVIIPEPIKPTPTPLPQFAIGLQSTEEAPENRLKIRLDIPRDIALEEVELFIDNELVQKVVSAPFDEFEVNLSELTPGEHQFRVEANDENGVNSSIVFTGMVTFPTPPPEPIQAVTEALSTEPEVSSTIPILPLVLIIVGLVLLVILIGLIMFHYRTLLRMI